MKKEHKVKSYRLQKTHLIDRIKRSLSPGTVPYLAESGAVSPWGIGKPSDRLIIDLALEIAWFLIGNGRTVMVEDINLFYRSMEKQIAIDLGRLSSLEGEELETEIGKTVTHGHGLYGSALYKLEKNK